MLGHTVCFGEILLRLAAPAPGLLMQNPALEPSFCGAEANVAVALSGLGHPARMVGALPDNALGEAARRSVAAFGVDMQAPAMPGRMGLYFLEPGAMRRPAAIVYDRKGSAFARSGPADYDWDALLDGAGWLFVGGITAALGEGPLSALREATAAARARQIPIAFDTNFRPALWRGRERDAAAILRELSLQSDLVFAGRRAVSMMTEDSFDHDDPIEGFACAARTMFHLAPSLRYMSATRRELASSDAMAITGLLADREGTSASDTVALEKIVDRVGTGDAFAAGILHGLLVGRSRSETVDFAVRAAEWAHSVPGDFLRASVNDIQSLASGGSDVKR